jgi:hypothetical protein
MTNLSHPHPVFSNYSLKRSEKLIITYRWIEDVLVNQSEGFRTMYSNCLINQDLNAHSSNPLTPNYL